MISLIQRVNYASVKVEDEVVGEISNGLLVFVAIEAHDTKNTAQKMVEKIVNYRVFSDQAGKMNESLLSVRGALLIVSQFTLLADTSKGRRPSFSASPNPEFSKLLFDEMISIAKDYSITVEKGQFGADMKVTLENDGPMTFWLQV